MYLNLDLLESTKNIHKDCQIAVQDKDHIVKQIIDSGIFIDTRRWIRSQLTISKIHPKTSVYYKSTESRRREESRHLLNHYYIIHPFSIFTLVWDTIIFFVYIYMLIVYSFDDLFMLDDEYWYYINIMKFSGDLIYVADIFHLFFRGYYDPDISKVVLNPRKIIKKYICTVFFIDLIAIIPSVCIPFKWLGYINEHSSPVLKYLRFAGIIRLLRIGRWMDTFEMITRYKSFSTYVYKTLKVFLLYAIILCALYFFVFLVRTNIRQYQEIHLDKMEDRYLTATLILMLASHGKRRMRDNVLHVLGTSLFLCAGVVLHMYLFTQLLQAWNTFIHAKTTTNNVTQQFVQYTKYKGLPIRIRNKILTFFEFRFQKDFYHEKRMQYFISEVLRNRILMDSLRNRVKRTNLLSLLPNHVLYKLVNKVKTGIYLEDDVIIRSGRVNDNIYFIHNGTVAVYNSAGAEMCHLEDGESFGELCLLLEGKKIVTITAIAPSEIFQIKKTDFLNVLDEFPDTKHTTLLDCRQRFFLARTGYF